MPTTIATNRPRSDSSPRLPFTLVELIAGLLLIAVLAAIFVPFLNGILHKTVDAQRPVQLENDLLTVMERIADDYDRNQALRADLTLLRSRILETPSPYGTDFTVVACTYIAFQDGAEIAGTADDNLKVVIANASAVLASVFPKEGG